VGAGLTSFIQKGEGFTNKTRQALCARTFLFSGILSILYAFKQKIRHLADFLCSGGWIRTNDFWVMSPTSYLCSTPQYLFGLQI
jgi:hypothetical protein